MRGETAPVKAQEPTLRMLQLRASANVAMASLGVLLLAYALLDWIAFARWVEAWL